MRLTQRENVMFCRTRLCVLSLAAALLPSNPSNASAQSCVGNPVAVQILGSGGPRINPERASASYLLWVDTQAKLLVDIGGGAFFRFGQSQARLGDLSMVAISHLHPDHVSDLPALLWTSNQLRKDPLPIFGPSGNDTAPDFSTFLGRPSIRRLAHFKFWAAPLAPRRATAAAAFASMSASST
jgi:ribonuclease BN (tRNA processing enzyme)